MTRIGYKMRFFVLILLVINSNVLLGQYHISGQVSQENAGNAIYLSLVEDYRKSSRVYLDQIVHKSEVDSLGHFSFEGDNLSDQNRIYRIHLDGCSDNTGGNHFLGQCDNSKNVLFIANNKDTLEFPTSFEEQSLCTINSTNPKSGLLLEIEGLKEHMAYDFADYPSEANKKMNLDKWFKTFTVLVKRPTNLWRNFISTIFYPTKGTKPLSFICKTSPITSTMRTYRKDSSPLTQALNLPNSIWPK